MSIATTSFVRIEFRIQDWGRSSCLNESTSLGRDVVRFRDCVYSVTDGFVLIRHSAVQLRKVNMYLVPKILCVLVRLSER